MLEAGADVTLTEPVTGEYGTALQAASAVGALEIVRELLKRHAVVNISPANGKYGNSLSAAAAGGHEDIVKLLIKHKADVNAKGGLYGFPILAGAQSGDLDIVQLLIDNGANASAEGGLFGSAIAAAAYGNNLPMIEQLVEHGADVRVKGGKYGNAIQAAAIKADVEIIDDLLNRAVELVNHRDGKYHTALIAASYFNRMEVVVKLLDGGADFRFQGGQYRSAITAAAIRGNKAILDKFLNMGPPDQLLDDALTEACAHRQSACVEALLKAGANVNARHPVLGLPIDALTAPEAEDENSDIEDENDAEDDDEGEDEDEDEDNEEDEWEGDNVSVTGETDEGSVTDLQIEEEISEAAKIQKLLDEAMARCKRNPTVKRFRTVKHHHVPDSLSAGSRSRPQPPMPPIPLASKYQTHDVSVQGDQLDSPYGRHYQEPYSLPFRSESGTEYTWPQYGQQNHQSPANAGDTTYPAPLFAKKQTQSPSSSPTRVQSPQKLQQQQSSTPPHQRSRQSSAASSSNVPQTFAPLSRQGSGEQGLKRQSKALNRKPLSNPGPSGRYQERQLSQSKQSGPDRSASEHDFAASNHYTPPAQHYPPPLGHRQSQQFNQGQPMPYQAPPPTQYQPYTAPPPQHGAYDPYRPSSQISSPPPSIHGSQYANSTPYGSQSHLQWGTPNSSQESGFSNIRNPNEAQGRRWGSGGYDGEGYN